MIVNHVTHLLLRLAVGPALFLFGLQSCGAPPPAASANSEASMVASSARSSPSAAPSQGIAVIPAPRAGAAMAWDPKHGYLLMFGGADLTTQQVFADTWKWDGKDWTRLSPPVSPPGRSFGAMAFDPVGGTVLLYGGGVVMVDPPRHDTWAWDGTTWAELHPAEAPPPTFYSYRMVTDSALPGVLLVGAATNNLSPLSTWAWTGTTWRRVGSSSSVPARAQFCMASDSGSGVVLHGGFISEGEPGKVSDTWVWAGGNWLKRSSAGAAGGPCLMAYDQARRRIVMFVADQTWTYDSFSWTKRQPAHQPSKYLSFSAFAYDEANQSVVLFGGKTDAVLGSPMLSETWTWDGADWSRRA